MKTIVYRRIKKLAGMASTYNYVVEHPHCVMEIKSLDYLVPAQNTTLVLEGERLKVLGLLFDMDSQTLKILVG